MEESGESTEVSKGKTNMRHHHGSCPNPKDLLSKSKNVQFCWENRVKNACDYEEKDRYENGDEVIYSCTSIDDVLEGRTQAVCQYNGTWTDNPPTCNPPKVIIPSENDSVKSVDLYKWIGIGGSAFVLIVVLLCVFYRRPRRGQKSTYNKCEIRTNVYATQQLEEPSWYWRVRRTFMGNNVNANRLNDKGAYEEIQSTRTKIPNLDEVNTLPIIYEDDRFKTGRQSKQPPGILLNKGKEETNTYAMVEMRMKD